uniref:Large ribosomal subunit protein mL53 n=1 Tax=Ascaris lumbricoides TaxID=6252 RepID=A0A0M3HNN4_ASCLU
MCKMWERIRYGVKWVPSERLALANRALDLKNVKTIDISIDPFHPGNGSIREFWFNILAPRARLTNPQLKVKTEIRNDRKPPFFCATLADGRRLVLKTNGMQSFDVVMQFNRLLGNPELGKTGVRTRIMPN